MSRMNIVSLGAGAAGGVWAFALARAGHQVTCLDLPGPVRTINDRGGITVENKPKGTKETAPVRAVTQVEDVRGTPDCIVVAVKSFHLDSAIATLKQFDPSVPVVCPMNGVDNEGRLREALGDRVIPATLLSAISFIGTGNIAIEKDRGIGLGGNHPLNAMLASALIAGGIQTRLYPEAEAMKWTKLLTNLLANPIAAVCDVSAARVYADPQLYRIEICMLRELLAVMKAKGLSVVSLPGTPTRPLAVAVKHLPTLTHPILQWKVGTARGDKKPSLHLDLLAGRRLEVEDYTGAVDRHAKLLGIPAPVNAALTKILKAIEADDAVWERYKGKPQELVRAISARKSLEQFP